MNRKAAVSGVFLFFILGMTLSADGDSPGTEDRARSLQGYAGPGWSVLFEAPDTAQMASLGPVMFRISEKFYLGPIVAYEESSSEGPGSFLGGVKVEGYLEKVIGKLII